MKEGSESVYGNPYAAKNIPEVKKGDTISVEFSGPHGIQVEAKEEVIGILKDGFVTTRKQTERIKLAVRAIKEDGSYRTYVCSVSWNYRSGWEGPKLSEAAEVKNLTEIRRKRRKEMKNSSRDTEASEKSKSLYEKAKEDGEEVDLDELERVLSTPTAPTDRHASAVLALTEVVRDRDGFDGSRFVEDLATLLGRPSLKSPTVLWCLYEISREDPESVTSLYRDIVSCIEIGDDDVNRPATSCCVEIAKEDVQLILDDVPLFGSLLHSKDETVRRNSVYLLSLVADEHPEEALPAVRDAIEGLEEGDDNAKVNKSSLIGKVSRHYPDATVDAVPHLSGLLEGETDGKVAANAVGALADIAKEHPKEVVDVGGVESASEVLDSDDRYVRYNACSLLEEISNEEPDAIRPVVPELLERLEDCNEEVRAKAIYALGEIREDRALDRLKEVRKKDTSDRIRGMAGKAVERIERS